MKRGSGNDCRSKDDEKEWLTSYSIRNAIFGACKDRGNSVEFTTMTYTPMLKKTELNGGPDSSDSHSSSSTALAKHVRNICSPKAFNKSAPIV